MLSVTLEGAYEYTKDIQRNYPFVLLDREECKNILLVIFHMI